MSRGPGKIHGPAFQNGEQSHVPRCARQWELALCRGGCYMGASGATGRCDAGGEHTSIHPDIPWAPALWQSVGRAVETVSDSPACWGLGVDVAAVLRASHWAVGMPVRLQGPRCLTLISTLAGQASAPHPAEEETGSEGLTCRWPGKFPPWANSSHPSWSSPPPELSPQTRPPQVHRPHRRGTREPLLQGQLVAALVSVRKAQFGKPDCPQNDFLCSH